MQKVSIPFRRGGKSGWWIRWQDPSTKGRKMRRFNTKSLAEHFQHLLYHKLNSDVFISAIDAPWGMMIDEYLQSLDVKGRKRSTREIADRALTRFQEKTFLQSSASLTQGVIDAYLLSMIDSGLSPSTINKEVQRVKSFCAWAKRRLYVLSDYEIGKLPVSRIAVKCLTTEQIRSLLTACPSTAWKIRILLSLCTGLRRNDIDRAKIKDLGVACASLAYVAAKTGKVGTAPIPNRLQPILVRYTANRAGRIFDDINVRKEWDNLRIRAGFYQLKDTAGKAIPENCIWTVARKDFRRTFSTLIQQTGGLASAQQLLQHSSDKVTLDHYTDIELILSWRVNQLPVDKWIEGIEI